MGFIDDAKDNMKNAADDALDTTRDVGEDAEEWTEDAHEKLEEGADEAQEVKDWRMKADEPSEDEEEADEFGARGNNL